MDRKFFQLEEEHTDTRRLKIERQKARELKKSSWWNSQIQTGICYYCEQKVGPLALTMDHIVPLARGGVSSRGNLVPCCQACNQKKGLETPVDLILG